ncbi:ATPase F0/V0 complex subunit C [Penicillium frequentans]|nr:ATPase F0/V0 complex subunit C [Penicillium glabrum]
MPVRPVPEWGLRCLSRSSFQRASYARKQTERRWNSAYTWLTRTPEAITSHDIVSSLPSTLQSNSSSVPLLLVTPNLAHLLDPTSPFVSDLISKLHRDTPQKPDTLHAIAAVVDRIPNSAPQRPKALLADDAIADPGEYDGVSMLIIGEDDVQWKATPSRRIGSPAGDEPSLTVSVRDKMSVYAVGLRLTNTVFLNGSERTFMGMRWVARKDGYVLDKSRDLASCVVTSTQDSIRPRLMLPLEPVTQRRRVVTGMGNILRQLAKSTDGSSDEPMPASTELEKKLPRYIEEHNIADRRVSVWALVETPDVEIADPSLSIQDQLTRSLRQGGKLHRVMSGGGGWGKKQGLLSLDPEVAFPTISLRDKPTNLDQVFEPHYSATEPLEMPSFFENGLIGEDLSHLSQVANAGDFIQFFVAVEPTPTPRAEDQTNLAYCFGVVADAEEPHARGSHGEEKHLEMVVDTFGAMSEKAITFSQPAPGGGKAVESSTKLDIPGCQVILEFEQL